MRASFSIILFITLSGFMLLVPFKLFAAGDLLIIQVQIAGEKASYDSVKIYNPANSDFYLGNSNGSYIRLVKRSKASTKDYTIKSWSKDSEVKIPAKGYYLWASSKDGYDIIVGADASTSQIISRDNGIALRVGSENTGEIIDAVGWGNFNNLLLEGAAYPENPGQDQKLERRKNNGSYQDTDNNSQDFYLSSLPETQSETEPTSGILEQGQQSENFLPQPIENKFLGNQKSYPSGIFINEILPSPTGPDETEEWIEIYNSNDSEVDLSGWQIQDIKGKTKTYIFVSDTKIEPQGFLVIARPKTKITLNNTGDGLNLTQPNGEIVDTVEYEKAPHSQSYNKTVSGWVWSDNLTPGSVNITSSQEPGPEEIKRAIESLKKETEGNKKGPAAIGQQFSQSPRLFVAMLVALVSAVFSGVVIFTIKRKLKKE